MTTSTASAGPLPHAEDRAGPWVGRAWDPAEGGPCVVTLRGEDVVDVTSPDIATVRDLLELDDPPGRLARGGRAAARQPGRAGGGGAGRRHDPAPSRRALRPAGAQGLRRDLRALDGRAGDRGARRRRPGEGRGDPRPDRRADRRLVARHRPGSEAAAAAKAALIAEGLWSQYLEVGHRAGRRGLHQGPADVGGGLGRRPSGCTRSRAGTTPSPRWCSRCRAAGASSAPALGNDVNLRDVEGRSALLLGKAKDNNAACAIGPFIRLFDDGFGARRRARGGARR